MDLLLFCRSGGNKRPRSTYEPRSTYVIMATFEYIFGLTKEISNFPAFKLIRLLICVKRKLVLVHHQNLKFQTIW